MDVIATVALGNTRQEDVGRGIGVSCVVSSDKAGDVKFSDLDFASGNPADANSVSLQSVGRIVLKDKLCAEAVGLLLRGESPLVVLEGCLRRVAAVILRHEHLLGGTASFGPIYNSVLADGHVANCVGDQLKVRLERVLARRVGSAGLGGIYSLNRV